MGSEIALPAAPSNGMIAYADKPSCLADALAKARDKCQTAVKDKRNTHKHFDYASADSVIDTAKAAMEGTGLSLVPSSPKIRVLGQGTTAFYSLTRAYALVHSSGETLPLGDADWPIEHIKGSSLDRCYASAMTSSLAYIYRDVLAMPRGSEKDNEPQDKSEPEAASTTPSAGESQTLHEALADQANGVKHEPVRITEAEQAELSKLLRETGTDIGPMLGYFGVKGIVHLTDRQFAEAKAILQAKPKVGTRAEKIERDIAQAEIDAKAAGKSMPTDVSIKGIQSDIVLQVAAKAAEVKTAKASIFDEIEKLAEGIPDDQFQDAVVKTYGKKFGDLDAKQLDDLKDRLKKRNAK